MINPDQRKLYYSLIDELINSGKILNLTVSDNEIVPIKLDITRPKSELKEVCHFIFRTICPTYPKKEGGIVSTKDITVKQMNEYIDWLYLVAAESGIILNKFKGE